MWVSGFCYPISFLIRPMVVSIRYFAGHRDITGRSAEQIALPEGATVGGLWEALVARYPRLGGYRGRLLYAVNQEYATPDTPLRDGDEVSFIPPVSGGAPTDAEPPTFLITEAPLDASALTRLVAAPDMGAIVTFAGVVRDNVGGRATAWLVYEAYAPMAEKVLARLADEARARWEIGRVAIHHRVGRLEIGETAVLVVVAAPHRRAAFEAAAWIMDRIKEVAPIWKKEHWADGTSQWVGSENERGSSVPPA
jgi:molybdopterin converting factor subunit 1